MTEFNKDITEIKGVGEKTAELFHKLGVFSCEDLLYYFPRDYVRYDDLVPLSGEKQGEVLAFKAVVEKRPLLRRAGRLTIVSAKLYQTETRAEIDAIWFNQPYLTRNLKPRSSHIFYGRLYQSGKRLCIDQPLIFTEEQFEEIKNSLQPVYPLTKGLSNNTVKKSVKRLLTDISSKEDQADFTSIHFPKSFEELRQARERFVYDEFFLYLLRLRRLKDENARARNDFGLVPVPETEEIIRGLPYSLTGAQERAWREIEKDLTGSFSMNRLVQGDVGSGKTIIAFLAAVMTAINGCQCTIMAPTEILASQHYEALQELFEKQGLSGRLSCVLLTGSMTAAQKKAAREEISSGRAGVIIGTQALFQEKVVYHRLALVITDEQHRFGVAQREALRNKNSESTPHVLVMSATPIPRTLAIILYGDLDISVIDEVPARRLPIKNCVVGEAYHETAYRFMEKQIREGRQCYVICPLVEESEGVSAKDVKTYTEILRSRFPSDIGIGCLHGKLRAQEKAKVMDDFYSNRIQILVSTTVVEVGVNVPNATVMMVENAERFGLAQLHQLRGRIGRGEWQSYCIFINSDEKSENKERLEILVQSNDGFYISGKDLELRGPGELFGVRQSGELTFRLGDIYSDAAILKRASEDVNRLLSEDPELSREEHAGLREKLKRMTETEGETAL
ncbi:MAG: ATP-dependent DNA helicase RecG [Lachnospiraceae bacterium]|nr:ATP-dependent DNA helicase RecG [Lachnospiraceae bacterium]